MLATNGVVIATEKKVPSVLVDEKSIEKIALLRYAARWVGSIVANRSATPAPCVCPIACALVPT